MDINPPLNFSYMASCTICFCDAYVLNFACHTATLLPVGDIIRASTSCTSSDFAGFQESDENFSGSFYGLDMIVQGILAILKWKM